MRPNYAQDAPPVSIGIGGADYPVNTDFRVWIEVEKRLRELRLSGSQTEYRELCELVFGGVPVEEPPEEVLTGIAQFLKGYPVEPNRGTGGGERVFSFEYDLNSIILAIRNQSGIDLSYRRREPFHWWEFLLEFHTLCGDHYILNLMEARGYRGKDRELLRRKRALALPEERTREEQEELDEFSAQFGDGWEDEDEDRDGSPGDPGGDRG